MAAPRPIIVLTGANSGVGFGISQRLLVQLTQKNPTDALPQFQPLGTTSVDSLQEHYDGLTLIMACRSEARALAARSKLIALLDSLVAEQKALPGYDGHAERFRKNVEINYHHLDMLDVNSTFRFTEELSKKYSYVSHLICNAGAAFWTGIDRWAAVRSTFKRGFCWTVTLPPFKLQSTGIMSNDGLGATWQGNLFGHYILYRRLRPLLLAYASLCDQPSRVIWTSSLESQPRWYDRDDWQLVKTDHAYEASKYQIDLVAGKLDKISRQQGGEGDVIRHMIAHPGVSHSEMTRGMVSYVTDICKILAFYVARLLGSPHHPIDPIIAAASVVHIALAAIVVIPTSLLGFAYAHSTTGSSRTLWDASLPNMELYDGGVESAEKSRAAELEGDIVPIKFGTQTDRRGRAYVGVMPVFDWAEHEEEADYLLEKCEGLYQSFSTLQR
ncbi:hypothetical protein BDW22DRAFT_485718 [Trametopsis cervina]|nr:hypothetical protein BDW22DRAFT_485718 [Trametopsis cervina]